MFSAQKSKQFLLAAYLGVASGILYNSWPLGYWLNPLVSRRGLASELQAMNQPYNWLFVLLDVISGLLVMIVALLLWRRSRYLAQKIALATFAFFGVMTIVSAVVPMNCEPSLTVCPSLTQQPLLLMHGISSILASVSLFVSVCVMWWQKHQHKSAKLMSMVLVGWIAFGVVSTYFFFVPGPGYIAQHYYITLCSLWIALLPFMVNVQVQPKRAPARVSNR